MMLAYGGTQFALKEFITPFGNYKTVVGFKFRKPLLYRFGFSRASRRIHDDRGPVRVNRRRFFRLSARYRAFRFLRRL